MDANGNKYSVGDIVHIRITNIVETIGVFVRMPNGNDGLIRKSDFAWFNQNVIMKSFSVGDELDVEVIKELPDGRLNLSRKSLLPNPRTLKEGELVSCRVKEVKQFGLIVKLGDFTALIHKTELPPFVRYSENDSINCIVLKNVLDEEKQYNKVYLSILALHMLEIEKVASQLDKGYKVEAEVFQVESSKVIIKIGGAYGIIKKEDVSWNEIDRLEDVLYNGETINAVYLKNDNGKLLFSLKLLKEKPYNEALYELSLSDLLKYIGQESNVFIGQAKQYPYGLFIENLYSVSDNQKGKLLIDPIYGYNLRAIIPNANFNVEENKYYKIELRLLPKDIRLERNQLFQFVAINVEEAENPYKTDVDLTFKKSTSPRDCVALAHTLSEVGKNMYSSKDRMFFELIQNADDAAAQDGVIVKVKTQGDFLVIRHNGYSFDKDDFEAITSSANGTKKANENKTGYKGIGFKSVFTDSDIVFIKTGGYQFKFDKNDPQFMDFERFYFLVNGYNTEQQKKDFLQKYSSERSRFRGVSDIPWQMEPIWIDNFPEELGDDFMKSNVAIALKLGETKILGDNGYSKAIEDIISNPCFMLFLRNTKRIDFNGRSVSRSIKDDIITLKNSFKANRIECFKREDFEIEVNNDVFEKNGIDIRISIEEQDEVSGKIIEAKFVDSHNQEIENIPKKIAINNSTAISFAIPIYEGGILRPNTKYNEISLFAFLPTLVKDFKFAFYINANFILDPPRQRILGDNPWNFYLMQEIARCLVQWCASLNEKKDKNALNILLPKYFDNNDADNRQLAEHFNLAYKTALESEAFILNHKGELAKQGEIIIDETGLSEIIGADLFCQLLNTEKCLPYGKIDSKILEEAIFEEIELLKFDNVIDVVTNNSIFNEWFVSAKEEQKKALYKWIVGKNTPARKGDLRSFVLYLPLFQFDTECKSCTEIDSSEYIITTEHIEPMKEILPKLGFVCSDNLFDKNHPLYEFVNLQDEDDLFNSIKDRDFSDLTADERRTLFFSLADFDGVGTVKLKDIALFRNINGVTKPLGEMVAYRDNTPLWLSDYILCKEDNDVDLSDYLISQEDEFASIIQQHINDIETSFSELYSTYKEEWTGQFTRQLIDYYDIDDNLLTIIEDSDRQTKNYFLNSIKKLELHSTSTYKKNSYEYRVLQLALSTYDEPSVFSPKIYFDEKCIKDFSVSDEVICEYTQNGERKKVKMSLAKLLPQYQNLSDSIDKIKALFESKKDLDKFFVAKPKPLSEVYTELNDLLQIIHAKSSPWDSNSGNAYQYLFSVYKRKQVWSNLFGFQINLEAENDGFVKELLCWLYDNGIQINTSPFTCHLKNYFSDKHFDSDYIFENEQLLPLIEKWADDEKKIKYLKDNGVQTSDCNAIQFRKLFLENKPINFFDKLSDGDIKSGIEFIATASGFERPFVGENQKNILLFLKDKCKDLTRIWDDKKMEEKAMEWNSKEYNEWIKKHYPHIYIYPGFLPRQLSYKDIVLLNYDDPEYDYYYNKQEKKLYVSNVQKIEDILFEVAKEHKSDLEFDDYKELCLDGKVSISKEDIEKKDKTIESLEEANRKKDEIIENLRAKLKAYEKDEVNYDEKSHFNSPSPTIAVGKHSGIGDKPQWDAQLEAQNRLIQEFPQWTFPSDYGKADDNGKPYNFSTIEIEDENDKTIPIVLKSYKKTSEPFKINTEEWNYLIREHAVLLIYTGADVKRVYVRDLIRKQSSIAISFSTENLEIEDKVNAFADSLHYFNELHFDFDSFNISGRVQSAAELYKRNKRAFFANDNTEDDI